jgi:hypothetical protein
MVIHNADSESYIISYISALAPAKSVGIVRAAMRKVWDSVDNRMGQMVYDNLFYERAVKDIALITFRAYGWQLPPKYWVAQVMGFVKSKSAIHIARVYAGRRRSFVEQHFRARGYWVSTVGKEEAVVRRYIQEQEKEDQRLDQMTLMPL